MNINYVTINELTEIDKLRFIKFIYDNTDSFILNTFGHTWSGRDWWTEHPIEVCTDDVGQRIRQPVSNLYRVHVVIHKHAGSPWICKLNFFTKMAQEI